MKRLASLLILLLLMSAQVDDLWADAAVLPSSAPPAADNDEYLPAQRRQEKQSAPVPSPAPDAVALHQAVLSLAPRGVPSERSPTAPFTPPPLYVLMSLQI
jgi:hypothetical protein